MIITVSSIILFFTAATTFHINSVRLSDSTTTLKDHRPGSALRNDLPFFMQKVVILSLPLGRRSFALHILSLRIPLVLSKHNGIIIIITSFLPG